MNRNLGQAHYSTSYVEDKEAGCSGLELYKTIQGKRERVASVIFWDACGQFCVETFGTDVSLDIMEALIAETKERIKVR